MQGLANLRPDSIGTDEDIGVCLGSIFKSGADPLSVSQILKGLHSRLDPDGALGYAVFDQNLLNDGPIDDDGGRQTSLQSRADGVESDQPISLVVQSSKLVPLLVANLEARNAVGRHSPSRHQFLEALGIDPLDSPQGIGLDLDRTAVRGVRRGLLEDGHLHPLGVAGCGRDEAGQSSAGHQDGQGIVPGYRPAALGSLAGRPPPRLRIGLTDQHVAQGGGIGRCLVGSVANAMGPVFALGLALRCIRLGQDGLDIIRHVDLVVGISGTLGQPGELRQIGLHLAKEGGRSLGFGLLARHTESRGAGGCRMRLTKGQR
mmetsp:Transcript_22688/g.65356  ORF Transcript_22688/g.65356 Transcript_22688/m.65356 type:complete len:317 (-) Transcript_22688:160-1110(-)